MCAFRITYDGVTPELGHFSNSHGHQQRLPDLHFKHLSNEDLSWSSCVSTVIYHCPFKVVQKGLEMENQLVQERMKRIIRLLSIFVLLKTQRL